MNNIDKRIDQMSWCLKNNIKVGIEALSNTSMKVIPEVRLIIHTGTQTKIGRKTYKQNEKLPDTILDLYSELYKRLNK